MKRRTFLLAAAATTTSALASGGSFEWSWPVKAKRSSLLIAGSSAMLELNRALAREFSKSRPLVDIVVEKGGSLPGLIALKRGAIDVAAMSRDLTAAEDDPRTHNFLIARNNIAIVVNRKSPITSLSREQVRALLSGTAANWKQVGGPDAPVRVISRQPGSASRQFVEEIVLGGDDIATSAQETTGTKELTERVATDPFAIGYVALKNTANIAGDLSYLQIDGIAASRATVLSGRYPYTQSFYLVLYGDKPGPATEFVAFARSRPGQKIVEEQYLFPVC